MPLTRINSPRCTSHRATVAPKKDLPAITQSEKEACGLSSNPNASPKLFFNQTDSYSLTRGDNGINLVLKDFFRARSEAIAHFMQINTVICDRERQGMVTDAKEIRRLILLAIDAIHIQMSYGPGHRAISVETWDQLINKIGVKLGISDDVLRNKFIDKFISSLTIIDYDELHMDKFKLWLCEVPATVLAPIAAAIVGAVIAPFATLILFGALLILYIDSKGSSAIASESKEILQLFLHSKWKKALETVLGVSIGSALGCSFAGALVGSFPGAAAGFLLGFYGGMVASGAAFSMAYAHKFVNNYFKQQYLEASYTSGVKECLKILYPDLKEASYEEIANLPEAKLNPRLIALVDSGGIKPKFINRFVQKHINAPVVNKNHISLSRSIEASGAQSREMIQRTV